MISSDFPRQDHSRAASVHGLEFGLKPPERISSFMNNDRGVALIIVLLVTALLVALIFEFAYGTRISLRAAVNFRDSQRAYYLARSGVNFVGRYLAALQTDSTGTNLKYENLEKKEWQTVPFMPGVDAELRVRWEDEGGKISISSVFMGNDAYKRLGTLFEILAISQDTLNRVVENNKNYFLTTELHRVLSDEEFRKLKDFVTVRTVNKIDINTAPSEVLQSLGLSRALAGTIIEKRSRTPFVTPGEINNFPGMTTNIAGMLDITSDIFKVYSYATVGGYTKQVEAVITRSTSGYTVNYWRAL